MVGSHLISEIFDIFRFLCDSLTSPPRIDPPSDIRQTRTSDHIPPRVDIWDISIFSTKNIGPTIIHTTIEPRSFKWVKSYFSFVCLRSSQVNLMMCTVEVSSPENMVSLRTKHIHITRELCIKNQFSLPRFFAFSTIRKINPKNIIYFTPNCHLDMCNTPLICSGIFGKTIKKANIGNIRNSPMDPYARPSISGLFSRIVMNPIILRSEEIFRKLIGFCFDFLEK